MKIEVNVSRKYLFVILGVVLILAAGIAVYAAVDTTKPYHDVSQISGIPTCGAGTFLTQNSTGLFCQAVPLPGTIVGGGNDGGSHDINFACASYGTASCSGYTLLCPAGSTKRVSGSMVILGETYAYNAYACVKN